MRIAFAGNPNSGKTTMYNHLTGRSEKVGNWAGVTVDRKEAPIRKPYSTDLKIIAVDLPGAYSVSPFTSEERITSTYIRNEHPDVIVNIVDATNLSRSLFFTTQLLELGIPMVVALNKTDINEKRGTTIDTGKLSARLGCPVVETSAVSGKGLGNVIKAAASVNGKRQRSGGNRINKGASDRKRYALVNGIVREVESRRTLTRDANFQDRIDAVLTHPVWGLLIFAGVMFLVFQTSQAWAGPRIAAWLVGWIEGFQAWVAGLLEGGNDFLVALLTEGMIGGVSAVVGFLPIVMVMFFLISLLEDCGYMARATVVLDPICKKVGLSGKSVIPFIMGTGCAVPGVMAARTIRNERERNAAVMLTPFMPCGAKMTVIALFAGAFFGDAPWVGTLMYFVGIALILLCSLLVNRITGGSIGKSYFMMELPEYKVPSLHRAVADMCARGRAYIVKAGTVILLCNAVVFTMQSFDWNLRPVVEANTSMLAAIANPIAAILVPVIGVRAWRMAAAAVTGFIAKENVVGTLAVCYGLANLIHTDDLTLIEGAGTDVAAALGITKAAALAYLMFNLFTPPCVAAIGAMNAEIKDKKWLWGGIALQLGVGYTLGFLVYQIGTLLTTHQFGPGFTGGLTAVTAMAGIIVFLCVNGDSKQNAEYAISGRRQA